MAVTPPYVMATEEGSSALGGPRRTDVIGAPREWRASGPGRPLAGDTVVVRYEGLGGLSGVGRHSAHCGDTASR